MNENQNSINTFVLQFVREAGKHNHYIVASIQKPVRINRALIPARLIRQDLVAEATEANWQERPSEWELTPLKLRPFTPVANSDMKPVNNTSAQPRQRQSYARKVLMWINANVPTPAKLLGDQAFFLKAVAVMGISRVAKILGWTNLAIQNYIESTFPNYTPSARHALKLSEISSTGRDLSALQKFSDLNFQDPNSCEDFINRFKHAHHGKTLTDQFKYIKFWIAKHYEEFSSLSTNNKLFYDAVAMLGFDAVMELMNYRNALAVREALFKRANTHHRSFDRKLEIILDVHNELFLDSAHPVVDRFVPNALFKSFAHENKLSTNVAQRYLYSHGLKVERAAQARARQSAEAFRAQYDNLLAIGFKVYNKIYLVNAEGKVFKAQAKTNSLKPVIPVQRINNRHKLSLCVSVGEGHVSYLARIVAELFVPNPRGYNYVTLIDGNYENCVASNVSWIQSPSDGRFVQNREKKWIDWILANYLGDGVPVEEFREQLAKRAREQHYHDENSRPGMTIQSIVQYWANNGEHSIFLIDESHQNRLYLKHDQLERYYAENWKVKTVED